MPRLTGSAARQLDEDAIAGSAGQLAAYLEEAVGQRIAARMAGLDDPEQISRYARGGDPEPHATTERRLREGYKVVRMLVDAYDAETARAWLFGTNSRLDDRAPIVVLASATGAAEFAAVLKAARELASFDL
jgi:hypothetical protein